MRPLRTHVSDLVSPEERHLKSPLLDPLEFVLLVASGLFLFAFTATVFLDVVTRLSGSPILWLQEATLGAFVWGTFIGASAALRRREHFCVTSLSQGVGAVRRRVTETVNAVVILVIGVTVAYFGYVNFQQGFGNQLPVTGFPLASLTGAIPVFGVLISVFAAERLVLGMRLGFAVPDDSVEPDAVAAAQEGRV